MGQRRRDRRRVIAAALCGLISGCAVGPDYQAPDIRTPDAWHVELVRGLERGEPDLRRWWAVFEDAELDSLIERADDGNFDLAIALARVMEGRARLGLSVGELFPDVNADGSIERTRDSENVEPVVPPPLTRTDTLYTTGFDASWEIDVFGRIRRSIQSSEAGLEADVEDYRDVLVSLYADVAAAYVDVRVFQQRIRYAQGNVEIQRGSLDLTERRRRAGLAPELDVSQARLNLARTRARVPPLRQGLAGSIHRLGVLLGLDPSATAAELAGDVAIPRPPGEVLVGVPADLLRQRPDVRAAERELAAQTARIGVATAELYPRFSLSGAFAWESFVSNETFTRDSRAYSYGPAMRWNLFDGGRIRSAIRVQDARTLQALSRYEQTVLAALEEAENAFVGFVQERERRELLVTSVAAAQESVRLVRRLYTSGLTDFQNVLSMEESLAQQQDDLAKSEGSVAQNLIAIYLALGGGWDPTRVRAP